MRHRLRSHVPFSFPLAVLASAIVVWSAFSSCTKTKFASGRDSPGVRTGNGNTNPDGSPRTSPSEVDEQRGLCGAGHKAARLAFVVDNSESNGPSDGQVQQGQSIQGVTHYDGTDPVLQGLSLRQRNERYTLRQSALWDIVRHTAALDAKARAANPKFIGSELGIGYFPLGESYEQHSRFGLVSGPGGQAAALLGRPMTNTQDFALNEAFMDSLWTAFAFTHHPRGMTPYEAALAGGAELLNSGRIAQDIRDDVLFIITDGIPTDEQPSRVRAARGRLGKTRVVVVSLFKPGNDVNLQNSAARTALKKAFENPDPAYMWARKPGRTDGYGPQDFDRYWIDLLKLPKEIADRYVEVEGAANLRPELERLLKVEQTCP